MEIRWEGWEIDWKFIGNEGKIDWKFIGSDWKFIGNPVGIRGNSVVP